MIKKLQVQKAPNELIPFTDPRIRWPMFESEKFDGFRMVNGCGEELLTSALKPFANQDLLDHFQDFNELLKSSRLVADGELWSPALTFNELQSIVTSHHRGLDSSIGFYVFQLMTEREWNSSECRPFIERDQMLRELVGTAFPYIHVVLQTMAHCPEEAERVYQQRIDNGEEGSMLQSPYFGYKHGRATHNESVLYKFKNYIPGEGRIIEVIIQNKMIDGIDRTRDTRGLLDRPHCKNCFEPDTKIAGFQIQLEDGTTCGIKAGKGFTNEDKSEWYRAHLANPNHFIGRRVEFKHMPHGAKDKPRIGSFTRFRFDLE